MSFRIVRGDESWETNKGTCDLRVDYPYIAIRILRLILDKDEYLLLDILQELHELDLNLEEVVGRHVSVEVLELSLDIHKVLHGLPAVNKRKYTVEVIHRHFINLPRLHAVYQLRLHPH